MKKIEAAIKKGVDDAIEALMKLRIKSQTTTVDEKQMFDVQIMLHKVQDMFTLPADEKTAEEILAETPFKMIQSEVWPELQYKYYSEKHTIQAMHEYAALAVGKDEK